MSNQRTYTPEDTKRRLIEAGLKLFGRAGRDGVSTRELASEADVSLNAIQYHFGGKDQVYLAVARHLTDTTGAQARAAAEMAVDDVAAMTAADAAKRAAHMLRAIVGILIAMPDAASRGGFMLREQLQPTEAFEILYPAFLEPAHRALTALVARATGRPLEDGATVTMAHALFGQALAFGAARETWHRRLGADLPTSELVRLAGEAIAELTAGALIQIRSKKIPQR